MPNGNAGRFTFSLLQRLVQAGPQRLGLPRESAAEVSNGLRSSQTVILREPQQCTAKIGRDLPRISVGRDGGFDKLLAADMMELFATACR